MARLGGDGRRAWHKHGQQRDSAGHGVQPQGQGALGAVEGTRDIAGLTRIGLALDLAGEVIRTYAGRRIGAIGVKAAKGRSRKDLELEEPQDDDKYQVAHLGHSEKVRPRAAQGKCPAPSGWGRRGVRDRRATSIAFGTLGSAFIAWFVTGVVFRKCRKAGVMLLPVALWLSFASVIAYQVYRLNPPVGLLGP
jgi:hypothetical protein